MPPVDDHLPMAGGAEDLGFDLTFVLRCRDGAITEANTRAQDLLGISTLPVVATDLLEPNDVARVLLVIEPLLRRGETWSGSLRLRAEQSEENSFRVILSPGSKGPDGTLDEINAIGRDTRVESTLVADLAYRATHDPLTDLPNRALLKDRLALALARTRRHHVPTALMFIDLDHFKAVNDAHGHAVGDTVLVDAAQRMRAALRPSDTLARLGGDEFVAVCGEVENIEQSMAIGDRLRRAIAAVHSPGLFGASIGVALTSDGRVSPEELMHQSDVAMYHAKRRGRNQIVTFEPGLDYIEDTDLTTTDLTTTDFIGAEVAATPAPLIDLRSDPGAEIDLRFDPIIDLETGETVSVAATDRRLPHADHVAVSGAIDAVAAAAAGAFERWGERAPMFSLGAESNSFDAMIKHCLDHIAGNDAVPESGFSIEVQANSVGSFTLDQVMSLHDLAHAGVPTTVTLGEERDISIGALGVLAARVLKAPASQILALPEGPDLQGIVLTSAEAGVTLVATGIDEGPQLAALAARGCRYATGPLFGTGLALGRIDAWIAAPILSLVD